MKEIATLLGVFLANTGLATFVLARFSQPERAMTCLLTIVGVVAVHLIEQRMNRRPIHSRYPKMSEADISRVREKLVQGRQSAYKRSA
jgi:hypothetical protein